MNDTKTTTAAKQATIRYIREKVHEIRIRYRNDEWVNNLFPAIKKSGKPVATFIKEAVKEKIERDGLR